MTQIVDVFYFPVKRNFDDIEERPYTIPHDSERALPNRHKRRRDEGRISGSLSPLYLMCPRYTRYTYYLEKLCRILPMGRIELYKMAFADWRLGRQVSPLITDAVMMTRLTAGVWRVNVPPG